MSLEELVRACAQGGDAAAWEEFVRRFHPLIAGVVVRTARRWGASSPALFDDLVQESYVKLCRDHMRLLREFEPQHPEAFYGYLKVIAANVVHDHFRALHSRKRGPGAGDCEAEDLGRTAKAVGEGTPDRIERAILLREVDAVLLTLEGAEATRDRAIFWLYYRQGLTAQAIAELPTLSVGVKGVESVLHRLTRLVRERLARRISAGEIMAAPQGNPP